MINLLNNRITKQLFSSEAVKQFKQFHNIVKLGAVTYAKVKLNEQEEEFYPGVHGKVTTKYLLTTGGHGELNIILVEQNCNFFSKYVRGILPAKTEEDVNRVQVDFSSFEDAVLKDIFSALISHFLKDREIVSTAVAIFKTVNSRKPEEEKKAELRTLADKLYSLLPRRISWEDKIAELTEMVALYPEEAVVYELEPPYPRGVVVQPVPGGKGNVRKGLCTFGIFLHPSNKYAEELLKPIYEADSVETVLRVLMEMLLPV